MVQDSQRSDWYYLVLEEGWLQAGDRFTRLDRSRAECLYKSCFMCCKLTSKTNNCWKK
jgi:MOSC domain-containing protein YiiM